MADQHADVVAVARRHGLSEGAGQALFDALVRGGGAQAQFSHPDVGGMGQWSGGMTQIGDMFNDALRAKVSGFCADLSEAARTARLHRDGAVSSRSQREADRDRPARAPSPWAVEPRDWWPSGLGRPAATGSQNGMRYACFPDDHRLVVDRDGGVTVYDTGEHRLTSFSQAQSTAGHLSFSGQNGPVALETLRVVRSDH